MGHIYLCTIIRIKWNELLYLSSKQRNIFDPDYNTISIIYWKTRAKYLVSSYLHTRKNVCVQHWNLTWKVDYKFFKILPHEKKDHNSIFFCSILGKVFCSIKIILIFTWNNITKSYGGHSNETEVKWLQKWPIFPKNKDGRTDTEKEKQKTCSQCCCQSSTASQFVIVIIVLFLFFIQFLAFLPIKKNSGRLSVWCEK